MPASSGVEKIFPAILLALALPVLPALVLGAGHVIPEPFRNFCPIVGFGEVVYPFLTLIEQFAMLRQFLFGRRGDSCFFWCGECFPRDFLCHRSFPPTAQSSQLSSCPCEYQISDLARKTAHPLGTKLLVRWGT